MAAIEHLHDVTFPKLIKKAKSISRCYMRARDMWWNAIEKIDKLKAKMEDIYDDFDDGIQAVHQSMQDNQDFIFNLANDVASDREGERE